MNTIQASAMVETPLGAVRLLASEDALVSATLDAPAYELPANAICEAAAAQLRGYFAGQRREFDLALAPTGTAFQQRVWQALGELPWGQCLTYTELAQTIGRPGAARAVGAAVGRNPLAIFIPCHRVLGAGGRLTGYAWGLERKRALLALEGCDARS